MWELFKSFSVGGRIGMVVGLLGGLAGCAAAIWAEPLVGSIMVVVFVGIIVLSLWLAFRPQIRRNRLVNTGRPAQATVLAIRETGWTVQGNYGQAELTLRVNPPDGGEAYEVKTRALVNRFDIPAFQPGSVLQVVIDPKDPKAVSVV